MEAAEDASHGGPAGTARRLPAGGGGAVLQILGNPGAGVEPAWEEARAGRAMVVEMAQKYQVSPAQFLLKFLLQQNLGVIPKASSMERMRQNLELPEFVITEEDMHLLRCLPQAGWSGEHPDLERVSV